MKKKFICGLLSLLLGVSTFIGTGGVAFAESRNIDSERQALLESVDFPEIRADLEENNVPEEKIEILIDKIINQDLWDSFTPGAEYIEETEVTTSFFENDTTIITKKFNDGSYLKSTSIKSNYDETNKAGRVTIVGSGITGGTITSSSYHFTRTDGHVYVEVPGGKLQFIASYTTERYGMDYISDVGQAACVNFSNVSSPNIVRGTEAPGKSALAQISGNPYYFPTASMVLNLKVGNDGASVYIQEL